MKDHRSRVLEIIAPDELKEVVRAAGEVRYSPRSLPRGTKHPQANLREHTGGTRTSWMRVSHDPPLCLMATPAGTCRMKYQLFTMAAQLLLLIGRNMCRWTTFRSICLVFASLMLPASTLEKMSVEQMTEQSTAIVRGRVETCSGELRGSVIYTVCRVAVSERWKGLPHLGLAGSAVDIYVPGGAARGLIQSFPGSPKFTPGAEYILFLWAGKSGRNQVIGLSQGAFSIADKRAANGATAVRAAVDAKMIDSGGRIIDDPGIELPVRSLRQRVERTLGSSHR